MIYLLDKYVTCTMLRYETATCLGHYLQLERNAQSEIADLGQRHVVRQVAAPYSVWQRFLLCSIESNVNENFKVIQNPGFLPDHYQNWITGSFCHSRHFQWIPEKSLHNFLSYLADAQRDRQTNEQTLSGKNITSLTEVTNVCAELWRKRRSSRCRQRVLGFRLRHLRRTDH